MKGRITNFQKSLKTDSSKLKRGRFKTKTYSKRSCGSTVLLLSTERTRVSERVFPGHGVLPEVGIDPEAVCRAPRVDRTLPEVADQVSGRGYSVRNP